VLYTKYYPGDEMREEAEKRMGENRNAYRVWVGNVTERHHLEDLDVDGSTLLR
jgi:hypothetical protein